MILINAPMKSMKEAVDVYSISVVARMGMALLGCIANNMQRKLRNETQKSMALLLWILQKIRVFSFSY